MRFVFLDKYVGGLYGGGIIFMTYVCYSASLISISLMKVATIYFEINKLPCAHWQIGRRALRGTLSITCSFICANRSGDYVARYNFKADVIITVSAWTVIAACVLPVYAGRQVCCSAHPWRKCNTSNYFILSIIAHLLINHSY